MEVRMTRSSRRKRLNSGDNDSTGRISPVSELGSVKEEIMTPKRRGRKPLTRDNETLSNTPIKNEGTPNIRNRRITLSEANMSPASFGGTPLRKTRRSSMSAIINTDENEYIEGSAKKIRKNFFNQAVPEEKEKEVDEIKKQNSNKITKKVRIKIKKMKTNNVNNNNGSNSSLQTESFSSLEKSSDTKNVSKENINENEDDIYIIEDSPQNKKCISFQSNDKNESNIEIQRIPLLEISDINNIGESKNELNSTITFVNDVSMKEIFDSKNKSNEFSSKKTENEIESSITNNSNSVASNILPEKHISESLDKFGEIDLKENNSINKIKKLSLTNKSHNTKESIALEVQNYEETTDANVEKNENQTTSSLSEQEISEIKVTESSFEHVKEIKDIDKLLNSNTSASEKKNHVSVDKLKLDLKNFDDSTLHENAKSHEEKSEGPMKSVTFNDSEVMTEKDPSDFPKTPIPIKKKNNLEVKERIQLAQEEQSPLKLVMPHDNLENNIQLTNQTVNDLANSVKSTPKMNIKSNLTSSTPVNMAFKVDNTNNENNNLKFSKSWDKSIRRTKDIKIDHFSNQNNTENNLEYSFSKKNKNMSKNEIDINEENDVTDDNESESNENQNEFIDAEAEEVNDYEENSMDEEERKYLEENEIPERGISLGSQDTDDEVDENTSSEKDSFIVSDNGNEEGEEDENNSIEIGEQKNVNSLEIKSPNENKKKKRRRLLIVSSNESDDDFNEEHNSTVLRETVTQDTKLSMSKLITLVESQRNASDSEEDSTENVSSNNLMEKRKKQEKNKLDASDKSLHDQSIGSKSNLNYSTNASNQHHVEKNSKDENVNPNFNSQQNSEAKLNMSYEASENNVSDRGTKLMNDEVQSESNVCADKQMNTNSTKNNNIGALNLDVTKFIDETDSEEEKQKTQGEIANSELERTENNKELKNQFESHDELTKCVLSLNSSISKIFAVPENYNEEEDEDFVPGDESDDSSKITTCDEEKLSEIHPQSFSFTTRKEYFGTDDQQEINLCSSYTEGIKIIQKKIKSGDKSFLSSTRSSDKSSSLSNSEFENYTQIEIKNTEEIGKMSSPQKDLKSVNKDNISNFSNVSAINKNTKDINENEKSQKQNSNKYDSTKDTKKISYILKRCDEILKAANEAKLMEKLKNKNKNVVVKKNTSESNTKQSDTKFNAIEAGGIEKNKNKKAVTKAQRHAELILMKKNENIANFDFLKGKLSSESKAKLLPRDILQAISDESTNSKSATIPKKSKSNEILAKNITKASSKKKNITKDKKPLSTSNDNLNCVNSNIVSTSSGIFIEEPITPQKTKLITKIELPTGTVYEEPISPILSHKKSGFIETPVTPVGFKVKNIMALGQDKVPDIRSSKKLKRKLIEPSNSLPKKVWTSSGNFVEEIYKPSVNTQSTEFYTIPLKNKKKGVNQVGQNIICEKALNFKKKHLNDNSNSDGRISAKQLLQYKERQKYKYSSA